MVIIGIEDGDSVSDIEGAKEENVDIVLEDVGAVDGVDMEDDCGDTVGNTDGSIVAHKLGVVSSAENPDTNSVDGTVSS